MLLSGLKISPLGFCADQLVPLAGSTRKSDVIVPKSLDKAIDRANPSPKNAAPGISIRNGPMVEMEIDEPVVNRTEVNGIASGKRKARNSTDQRKSYKEASDEEDEKPLVCDGSFEVEVLDSKWLTVIE